MKSNYIPLLAILLVSVVFISGCTSYSSEDIQKANPEETSKETALKMCNQKAKECSEGIPAIETEFKSACWQIYYYTGDPAEILDFAKGMC